MKKLLAFVAVFISAVFLTCPAVASTESCAESGWFVTEANKLVMTQPAKALPLYMEALNQCKDSANLYYDLALAQYATDGPGSAISSLSSALQIDPTHTDAMKMLAYVYVYSGIDPSKGRALAEALLAQRPDDTDAKRIILAAITGSAAQSTPVPVTQPSDKPAATATVKSDIDLSVPKSTLNNRDGIAVVIGNRDYESKDIPSVDFAISDATSVKNYLVSVLGYKEGNIIYLENASKGRFESVFGTSSSHKGRLYNYIKSGKSDIFVYYSGHGAPEVSSRQGYFVPSDADPQAIALSGYSLSTLYGNLEKIAKEMNVPKVMVVVDACFSGASEKGLLLKNSSPITIQVSNAPVKAANMVVLTSSGGAEVSSWYPEKSHSMFTYFFLKALGKTAGMNQQVTASALHKMVADETEGLPYYARRLHGRVQSPQLIGNGQIKLTR